MKVDARDSHGATPALSKTASVTRFAVIGVVVSCSIGAFAYAGGWLSSDRTTQRKIVAALQDVNGSHPGFRRAHAKGVCATGWFDGNGNAAALSTATLFARGRVPVIGRFAFASGMPFVADEPKGVRSLALRFRPPGADEWRTGMIDIPVFPFKSAQEFYEQSLASKPDARTGKPDPSNMKLFVANHPDFAGAVALIGKRTVSSGFADDTFNSLNTFRFVNAIGVSTPVRWSAVPVQPLAAIEGAVSSGDTNGVFDALIAQVAHHPVQWRLLITVGQPGDATNDPTVPWPTNRQHIDAGTLTIDKLSSEDGGPCVDVSYDPMVLPAGIEPSDDPIPSARSSAYARSFTLREEERATKPRSAVTSQEVASGGKS